MKIDIVIPACREEHTIGALLAAILADGDDLCLDVIVSLNGDKQREMRAIVSDFTQAFVEFGHTLRTICVNRQSKTAALNAADAVRTGRSVIYCDADVIFWPGTLMSLARALDVPEPRLAGARREIIKPAGRMGRGYAKVWAALPQVKTFIGAGCYAVNAAGRARWDEFPDIIADDAFVQSRFDSYECVIPEDAALWFEFPQGPNLIKTVRRWRCGNRQLQLMFGHRKLFTNHTAVQNNFSVFSFSMALFILVNIISLFYTSSVIYNAWTPARLRKSALNKQGKIIVRVIIVTYNSERYISSLLESIGSRWADLEVIAVDNASEDDSVNLLENSTFVSKIIKNECNLGFGAAVNQAANLPGDFDFLLLCNPDGIVTEGAVDQLLSIGLKAGPSVLGAQMLTSDGKPDLTSALAKPSFLHALCFAIGTSAWPMSFLLDPDRSVNKNISETRDVPVITGGFCLTNRALWKSLGGFDPHFFLYGEDVDLCVRAAKLGARVLSTGTATFLHHGGGSSANGTERMLRVLKGKIDLYRRYAPRSGRILLLTGCALRAAVEKIQNRDTVWRDCWKRRAEWA